MLIVKLKPFSKHLYLSKTTILSQKHSKHLHNSLLKVQTRNIISMCIGDRTVTK